MREGRIRLPLLGLEFRGSRLVLSSAVAQLRFALRYAGARRFQACRGTIQLSLRAIEFRLAAGKLSLGICLLAFVFCAFLVKLGLCLRAQIIQTRSLDIVGNRIDTSGYRIDLLLIRVARPALIARPFHRDKRLGIRVIFCKSAIGNIGKAHELAAAQRGRSHAGRAGVVARFAKTHDGKLAHAKRIAQILRALDQAHLVADLHVALPHRIGREQALICSLRPGAACENRAVKVVVIFRRGAHAVVLAGASCIHIERVVAQGALDTVDIGDGIGLVGGHNGSHALDRANLIDLVIVKAHR